MAGISTSMLLAAAAVREARTDRTPSAQRNGAIARACLQRAGRGGDRLLRAVDTRPGRGLLRLLEAACLPGIGAHYAWRKRRIRRWAQQACAEGVQQVLILGAGFDGLAQALLDQAPALHVFEVDREATLAIKQAALRALCLDDPRLRLCPGELGTVPLARWLRGLPGFAPDLPTLIVAEGLLMYLPLDTAQALLRQLARALPDARLIATAMALCHDGAPGFVRQRPWVRRWLGRRGEPFRWGATRQALPTLLGQGGVRMDGIADADDADDPDPAPGEWLFHGRLLHPDHSVAAASPHSRLRAAALP
ncbi:class I SAM-dependent methyltransferase [Pseudoxanthomonas winnipegensis]|uniref:class I SAM-dependent methyltransferase n=1 Tax=Pseudoxanthomonas winnipegensis TaxID=2480810 RepID=UPI00103FBD8F|nr:class I SAM-dependent methyltransferase [Pseudoxanthomonas winnipegensis]TBV73709.1 hypothetical protein EYC45_11710 [Pseudoxanthomonas winnipegensis]